MIRAPLILCFALVCVHFFHCTHHLRLNIRCHRARRVSQSSFAQVAVLFAHLCLQGCIRCMFTGSHPTDAARCCRAHLWVGNLSIWQCCTLGEGFHQQASASQLPSLDVYQTQQIKNGTDWCQNKINHSFSFGKILQTGHVFLSHTLKDFMLYKIFICWNICSQGFCLHWPLCLSSFSLSHSLSLWIIYISRNSFPKIKCLI